MSMEPDRQPLEQLVLLAFRAACAEERLAVAEHLLKALEAMAEGATGAEALDEAYHHLCDCVAPRRRS